jgi:hypothetical protein
MRLRSTKTGWFVGGLSTACIIAASALVPAGAAFAAAAPAVATGTVTGSSGSAASGATVLVLADPTGDQLDAIPEGGSAPEQVIGTATTNSSGGYTVSASDTSALASAAGSDGVVNLTIATVASNGDGSFNSISDDYNASTGQLSPESAGDAPTTAGPVQINPVLAHRANGAPVTQIAPNSAASPAGLTCGIYDKKTVGDKDTSIGRIFSETSGVTAKVAFNRSAHASLGIGVSASGDKGTFSASGHTKVTKSSSSAKNEDFTVSNSFKIAANTFFRYVRYYHLCASESGSPVIDQWEVHATSYQGPLHPGNMSKVPSYGHCYTTATTYHLDLSGTTGQTMDTGVDISADIGIDLSSQSGYNSTTDFDVHTTKAVQFCGTTGKASADSGPGELVIEPK